MTKKKSKEELIRIECLRLDENGNPPEDHDPVENALFAISADDWSPFVIEAIQHYAKLKAKDLDSRRCMYCGGSVPDTNEAMLEHVFSCEKRPEKKLLAKSFEVEDGLYAKIKHLMNVDRHSDLSYKESCPICLEITKALEVYASVPAEETNGCN